MVALLSTTLIGFAAMSVDIGVLSLAESQLQASLDAAVLGGVGMLDGTDEGVRVAVATATALAATNPVLGNAVALKEGYLQTGVFVNGAFQPSDDSATINALTLTNRPAGVGPIFAGVAFGKDAFSVEADALAFRPISGGPLPNSAANTLSAI